MQTPLWRLVVRFFFLTIKKHIVRARYYILHNIHINKTVQFLTSVQDEGAILYNMLRGCGFDFRFEFQFKILFSILVPRQK